MLSMQYIVDKDKTLLTIMFNNFVLKHLKCKCEDSLVFFQSIYKVNYLTIVKADDGYRIKRVPRMKKKTYQINIGHKLNMLKEFEMTECSYFLKGNNTVKIILKL